MEMPSSSEAKSVLAGDPYAKRHESEITSIIGGSRRPPTHLVVLLKINYVSQKNNNNFAKVFFFCFICAYLLFFQNLYFAFQLYFGEVRLQLVFISLLDYFNTHMSECVL